MMTGCHTYAACLGQSSKIKVFNVSDGFISFQGNSSVHTQCSIQEVVHYTPNTMENDQQI